VWNFSEFMTRMPINITSYDAERRNYYVTGEAWMGQTKVNKRAYLDDEICVDGTGHLHNWSMPLRAQLSGKVVARATYKRDDFGL
jgi:hypothetical protein